jgi:hypothetical protein
MFRKGDLVRLNPAVCFTHESGGSLNFPLSNYWCDKNGIVEGFRTLTHEERNLIMKDYRGLDSAGEPKLAPKELSASVHRSRSYPVLKARTCAVRSWKTKRGLCLILDTETGRKIYIKRNLMEKVT